MIKIDWPEIFRGFSLVFGISAPHPVRTSASSSCYGWGSFRSRSSFSSAVLFAISHFHVG